MATRKKDWRAPSQRSPYDPLSKRNRPVIEKPRQPEVKCEDPSAAQASDCTCPICRPPTINDAGGPAGFRPATQAAGTAQSEFIAWATRNIARQIIGPGVAMPSTKSAAIEAEEKAREPVKQFLFKATAKVGWSDIIGNEEAHRAMREAIELPVKHRDLHTFYGKKPTKGILLCGPPGCGKTMFGKAAASVLGELHGVEASLLHVKATQLQTPFVGQTEAMIRCIFAYARAYWARYGHQLVVFIDEADAILPSRDGAGGRRALPWEESNVSTFLTEMDGLEESGALVILGTNRPHVIDAALLRDGRCDRKIVVQRPTEDAARQILAKSLAGAPVIGDAAALVDVAMSEFFSPLRHLLQIKTDKGLDYLCLGDIVSGAMMVGLVERAKSNALHRDLAAGSRSGITAIDMQAAVDQVMAENTGRPDFYALEEKLKRIGAKEVELIEVRPQIRHAGSGTLQ